MASKTSGELSATEIELKRRGRRRLIGAITIGLLGIVFLPMIFDGEPRRSVASNGMKQQEISVQVPAKDGLPPLQTPSATRVQSPPVAAPQAPVASEPTKESPQAPVAAPVARVTALPPVVASKTEKLEPAATAKATVADKVGFAVQLGVYGDADNAKLSITKMKDAKLPVYTDSIPIKSGSATRIRVGPFATREKAESALAEIKLAGSDGKIVPLQ